MNQWNVVFYLAAAIYVLGNLIFIVFGSSEIQPWNNPENANVQKQSEKELTVV